MWQKAIACYFVAFASVSCTVDGYLACGEKCIDGGLADVNVTVTDGATDSDAPVTNDAPSSDACGLLNNGQKCGKSSECCSNACNSYESCVSSCKPLAMTCTTQPDTCCIGAYCSSGTCVMCLAKGVACAQDNQCCTTKCSSFGEAGKICVDD